MQYRILGSTGIHISALVFGAGPVPGLMTGGDHDRQFDTVRRALEVGINWFDTAAGYGDGRSEHALGEALRRPDAQENVHVATKVRLRREHLEPERVYEHVRESVLRSLERLGLPNVTLLQLHNSITARRGDEPTSITPADVLRAGGVMEAFERLRSEGLVGHIGLTGIGEPKALREVIESGAFQTIQVPFHLLNPSAAQRMPRQSEDTDYGNIIADCARRNMGVLAIRIFAGGALAGNPPSAHTHNTPFFPLALYQGDGRRAARLDEILKSHLSLKDAAARFALAHPLIHCAIIGFGEPGHVDQAVAALERGPLAPEVLQLVHRFWEE